MCESGVATSTFVTWLCGLAIVEEQELGSSNFPATRVQTCYSCIVGENRGSHIILSRNQGVALRVLLPSGSGIVSEEFVTVQALVSRLLGVLVIAELEFGIGGAAERACLGDIHVHGRLHGRLGAAHVGGGHFVRVCDDGIQVT